MSTYKKTLLIMKCKTDYKVAPINSQEQGHEPNCILPHAGSQPLTS